MANVSNENPDTSGNWRMPNHKPGEDPTWDALGDDWQAVDGVHPDARMYVRWHVDQGDEPQRPKVTGFCVVGEEITTEIIRSVPVSRLENLKTLMDEAMPADQFFSELVPLERHKGETPKEFSNRVAWYYKIFAAYSSKPTKDLAEHAGVPLPTMRSWIREARLRGALPQGTPGKSG